MTKKIYVIRHGETVFHSERKLQGHCNSPLTNKGEAQARSVGAELKKHLSGQNYQVYCSSLGRAVQTANIICEAISFPQLDLLQDDRLKEFSLGAWEQQTISDLVENNPNLLDQRDWYLRAPDCESYESVRNRLLSWLSELPDEQDVVVVSHGLTGIVLRGILQNYSYQDVWLQDLPQDAFFIVENDVAKRVNCKLIEAVA
ncbi:histidine phosphatase family protein [Vibrio panuliri]|uniref:Phosphoglycerate mutase n=1 Tax=Vibrio panuliri TaxID=1381081 RepID=A0ABX3FLM4_9VIBR|nr:histidine phosphatase family protein [Vibrio panuliri]KAB1454543.1 histidine phosphatase family protein [Vibrio panuliri]OLQ94973.1 phosphoglycerate mutase [Vibrio panuliri]